MSVSGTPYRYNEAMYHMHASRWQKAASDSLLRGVKELRHIMIITIQQAKAIVVHYRENNVVHGDILTPIPGRDGIKYIVAQNTDGTFSVKKIAESVETFQNLNDLLIFVINETAKNSQAFA